MQWKIQEPSHQEIATQVTEAGFSGSVRNSAPLQREVEPTAVDQDRLTTVEEDFYRFVPEAYHEFKDVFTRDAFDALPERSEFDHKIELKDSFTPQRVKNYRLSPKEQKELEQFLDEHLKSG